MELIGMSCEVLLTFFAGALFIVLFDELSNDWDADGLDIDKKAFQIMILSDVPFIVAGLVSMMSGVVGVIRGDKTALRVCFGSSIMGIIVLLRSNDVGLSIWPIIQM